jgi:hypothetical protein
MTASAQVLRSFLDAHSFTAVRPFTRMLYGSSPRFDDAARTFAVVGPEFRWSARTQSSWYRPPPLRLRPRPMWHRKCR